MRWAFAGAGIAFSIETSFRRHRQIRLLGCWFQRAGNMQQVRDEVDNRRFS